MTCDGATSMTDIAEDAAFVVEIAAVLDEKLGAPQPPQKLRLGFTVTERLDGVTLDALKELMRHVR
jgi:hypothetical protein